MRKFAMLIAAGALCAPSLAHAQIETVDPDDQLEASETRSMSDFADKIGDPETQEQLAETIATLSHVLLDLPLAPLADAAANAGVEFADEVPHDATLRQLAPDAERLPEEIAENLPRAMSAMASMAKGIEAMMPALKDIAERLEEALPRDLAPEA